MQIPSVRGLYQSRVGAAMGRAPVGWQPGADGFAGQYAEALGQDRGSGTEQQMTVTGGAEAVPVVLQPVLDAPQADSQAASPQAATAAAATPQAVSGGASRKWFVPASAPAYTSGALPLYIPAVPAASMGAAASQPAMGGQVVDFAKQFVGTPYVPGGEDLEKGVDCSGFTQSVYRQFGIKLPRSAYRQSMVGVEVDPKDLKPGDLLFYKYDDYAPVTHVTMYIGDGKVIHASGRKTGVIISKLKFGDDFVVARRLLPQ